MASIRLHHNRNPGLENFIRNVIFTYLCRSVLVSGTLVILLNGHGMKCFATAFSVKNNFHLLCGRTTRERKSVTSFRSQTILFPKLINAKLRLNSAGMPSPSGDMDTAFEWLAEDRFRKESNHELIRWFTPEKMAFDKSDSSKVLDIDYQLETMPLYPLGSVHIPYADGNYTIINIEPQNLKMSSDIANGKWKKNLFFVSLIAKDTGRIASVGTVMQYLNVDERLSSRDRIVVTCRAVGIADVISVKNPSVWGTIGLKQDYLVAQVKVRPLPNKLTINQSIAEGALLTMADKRRTSSNGASIAQNLVDDYERIVSIYTNSKSISSNELPPFATDAITSLPSFDQTDIIFDEGKFWSFIEIWQKICNTVREAKRIKLQSTVNKLSVEAALEECEKIGEPLQLPVKRKNLPEHTQKMLGVIEEKAWKDFIETGVDPILDFQQLLSMTNHWDRVNKLAFMIRNERLRLEAKEKLFHSLLEEAIGDSAGSFDNDFN